jgi:hypothetical protein
MKASPIFDSAALFAAAVLTVPDWLAFALAAERSLDIDPEQPGSMLVVSASVLFGSDGRRGIALRWVDGDPLVGGVVNVRFLSARHGRANDRDLGIAELDLYPVGAFSMSELKRTTWYAEGLSMNPFTPTTINRCSLG